MRGRNSECMSMTHAYSAAPSVTLQGDVRSAFSSRFRGTCADPNAAGQAQLTAQGPRLPRWSKEPPRLTSASLCAPKERGQRSHWVGRLGSHVHVATHWSRPGSASLHSETAQSGKTENEMDKEYYDYTRNFCG